MARYYSRDFLTFAVRGKCRKTSILRSLFSRVHPSSVTSSRHWRCGQVLKATPNGKIDLFCHFYTWFNFYIQLRKFIKTTNAARYRKQMKQLVDKVRSGSSAFKRYMNENCNEAAHLLVFFFPLIDWRNFYWSNKSAIKSFLQSQRHCWSGE